MISIAGLTPRQKTLMDLLWNCETMEQVELMVKALPTHKDRVDAAGLIQIATWESLEEEEGLDAYADLACIAISNARS